MDLDDYSFSEVFVHVGGRPISIYEVTPEIQERMSHLEYQEYFTKLSQVLPHPL